MLIKKKCAKYAAARAENSDLTPLNNTTQKGNMYKVMLTQYCRALGALEVRTSAEPKLRRTALIRQSRSEANATAQPTYRRYYYNEGNSFWYQNRRNKENFNELYAYHTQYENYYTDI